MTRGRATLRRIATDADGIGVIEVLVALFILTLVAVSVLTVFLTTKKANSTTHRLSDAYTLASQAIEQIREENYNGVWLSATDYPTTSSQDPAAGPPVSSSDLGTDAVDGQADFTDPAGQTEDLVTNSDDGTGVTPSGAGIAPFSYVNTHTGQTSPSSCADASATSADCATIERFITWAPQACPIADLKDVTNGLFGSNGTLQTLSDDLSGLTSNINASGLLSSTNLGTSSSNLNDGIQYALSAVGGSASSATSDTTAVLDNVVTGGLATLTTPVQTTLDQISSLLNNSNLSSLDLCTLPSVDLSSLSAATGTLQTLSGFLASGTATDLGTVMNDFVQIAALPTLSNGTTVLGDLVSGIGGSVPLTSPLEVVENVLGCLSNLTACLGTVLSPTAQTELNQLGTDLQTLISSVSGSTAGLAADLSDLHDLTSLLTNLQTTLTSLSKWAAASSASAPDQTKRITVAVVMPPAANGVQVTGPVWQSSLLSDPSQGLL